MTYVKLGEQDIGGTYARFMSKDEYETLERNHILGEGRDDYVPTFPMNALPNIGTSRRSKEIAKMIGIPHPDVLAIFKVEKGRGVYGPRQRIGGREVKIRAGTSVNLLRKINCR